MRDILHNFGFYELCPWGTYNGAQVSREFDTATGGQPERLLDANTPGDHMCPDNGIVMIYMSGTVGSACTLIDIDHRDRPGTGAWAELCSLADTANAAGLYIGEFKNMKRIIHVTWTVTTTTMCILLGLDRGRRDPVLNPGRAERGWTELAATYA